MCHSKIRLCLRDNIRYYGQEETVVPACHMRLELLLLVCSFLDIKLGATTGTCVDASPSAIMTVVS